MSDLYSELLVKKKRTAKDNLIKYGLIGLTALLAAAGLFLMPVLLIAAIVVGVVSYFIIPGTDLEFEYLFVNGELDIDKIMAKTKRKRVAVYQLDRMEILAPIKSYHLDNYRNRNVKEKDFSIGYEDKPDLRYAMYYEGGEKLILSPSPEMIKVMKNAAPRKVFND